MRYKQDPRITLCACLRAIHCINSLLSPIFWQHLLGNLHPLSLLHLMPVERTVSLLRQSNNAAESHKANNMQYLSHLCSFRYVEVREYALVYRIVVVADWFVDISS